MSVIGRSYHLGLAIPHEFVEEIYLGIALQHTGIQARITIPTSPDQAITLADSIPNLPTKPISPRSPSYLNTLLLVLRAGTRDNGDLKYCRELVGLHIPWLLSNVHGT